MTQDEVLRQIEAAIVAIQAYRQGSITKVASSDAAKDKIIREGIVEKSRVLHKEAFMLGSSGATCSRCGGSGREP